MPEEPTSIGGWQQQAETLFGAALDVVDQAAGETQPAEVTHARMGHAQALFAGAQAAVSMAAFLSAVDPLRLPLQAERPRPPVPPRRGPNGSPPPTG